MSSVVFSRLLAEARRIWGKYRLRKCKFSQTTGIKQTCTSLIYQENGDPVKVLDLMETTLPEPKKHEILIKMLAAPINPADINIIQGVYPVRPELPAIGGNEGVGEVVRVGSKVKNLESGDWVITSLKGFGTWRTHAVGSATDFASVPKDLPLIHAATLSVNPCTAYRMLRDFEKLEKGDVVIQNAANSAVGKAVIQIAAELQLRTVNVIRNRPNVETLIDGLTSLGATRVVTDESLRSEEMKEFMSELPQAKLGFNAVGGKMGAELFKFMAPGSTLVTYGGMSKQPLLVPAGQLIFKDVKLAGFWMSKWTSENNGSPEQKEMWKWLSDLIKSGKFQPPEHEFVALSDFRAAVDKSMQPFMNKKQIFLFDPSVQH